MSKTKYEISFQVKAIVSVVVHAETLEEAQKLAQAKLNKGTFAKGVNYIAGNDKICGYDNIDMWDDTN